MEKHEIIVPKGIRFVGEINPKTKRNKWEDYDIWNYDFPHILNKELTGCGYTEYCLNCIHPVVLISPRRFLLKNKLDQHPGDVYYFQNDDEVSTDYELDVGDDKKGIQNKAKTIEAGKNETLTNLDILKSSFRAAIKAHRMCTPYKPIKILVTYDSFKHVKDCLQHLYYDEGNHKAGYENILDRFQIVVDEFQSIFIDARFKSDAEIELLKQLRGIQRVCFVSATPMLDHYLEMLDEFKDLPYYRLNWEKEDHGRVRKPNLDIKFTVRSLNEEAKRVIDSYKDGRFDTRLDKDGNLIESREAVLYMNSVKGICQVIRSNMLHTDQVNILCAQTTDNRTKIRKAFNDVLKKETEELSKHPTVPKEYDVIGSIPLIGQQHKMFTLCTRTVYLGADFYSTNAKTFIFSDANIDCLSVDISMDLEQILGRQRLKENPWKNCATMFVKVIDKKHTLDKGVFDKRIEEKVKTSQSLLRTFEGAKPEDKFDLAVKYLKDAKASHYKDDYVAVTEVRNWTTGQIVELNPVFNNLMLVSEMRAFDVQQVDYKDRFTVFSAVDQEGIEGATQRACEMAIEFNGVRDSSKKLRMLVELNSLEGVTKRDISSFLELIPPKFKEYYTIIGPDFIKQYSCNEAEIKKEWIKKNSNEQIDVASEIYKIFEVGKRYTKANIKETLKGLYSRLGYQKTAKASDLEEYFNLKKIFTSDKKNGFELLEKK